MESEHSGLPPKDSLFWESPALQLKSKEWPERFGGKIPMRIKMLRTVQVAGILRNLPGFKLDTLLHEGEAYWIWVNSYGAIAGICANGQRLGVTPNECEIIEWYPEDEQI